jgi:hypothetical protein
LYNMEGKKGGKKMNPYHKRFAKLVAISLLVILTCMSIAQAIVQLDTENSIPSNNVHIYRQVPPQPLEDPFFTWEDEFNTQEWIDPDSTMSYNYEVENGLVKMKNTYNLWTDPKWTKMMPIELSNSGDSLYDYALNLIVDYDSDMQEDYDDLRFKHSKAGNVYLDYWIETNDSISANVWVNIPQIPSGNSWLYMFYGNPNADGVSDFYSVFTDWEEEWANDEQITYHSKKEGAWDPDVCYGTSEFLVTWEEGKGYWPPYTNGFKQEIRASIYEPDGDRIVFDQLVYKDAYTYYRNEDPSIAYGDGTWFVAWENFKPKNYPPHNPGSDTMNIMARTVKRNGNVLQLGSVATVCDAQECQADPNVEFDTLNDQFCVVWEDARDGVNDYDLWGRLYDSSGKAVDSAVELTKNVANSQCEPWIAFDSINEQYMIVWEEGLQADIGPFSIKASLYDEDLTKIGNTIDIATGNDNTDYNFPCVCFCEETERFLITWNDGDISDEDWYGNIWGIILDDSGDVIVDTFSIRKGNFIRTDIVPYLSSSFFVSFDDDGDIWGKLVSSEGDVFSGDIQLSASNSADADWANMAVGDEKIFVVWEDERIYYTPPFDSMPDGFGNIWKLNIPGGEEVTYEFGTEKKLILKAQITSKVIAPENLISWHEFYVDFNGSITFDILDSTGTTVLIEDMSNGEDISSIDPATHPGIRLRAHFSRNNPSTTPTLDSWSIIYLGLDEEPPVTTIKEILGTQGKNEWYTSNVKIYLDASDGQYGTGVNHTYFQIDSEDPEEYDDSVGIKLPPGDPNEPFGIWEVTYWSIDKAGNQEDPQGPVEIKIDKAPPHCEIWDPPDRANVPLKGDFWVQANANDEGSGIEYVSFDVGPPYENPVKVYTDEPPGSGNYKWLCNRQYNKQQWRHIIAQVHDYAGHMYEYNIFVFFGTPNEYQSGYVYLFGNPYGPFPLMSIINYAFAIDQNALPVILIDYDEKATHVDFIAKLRFRGKEFTFSDTDITDGCRVDMDIPIGIYSIIAKEYENGTLLDQYKIISKLVVILI